MTYSGRGNVGK